MQCQYMPQPGPSVLKPIHVTGATLACTEPPEELCAHLAAQVLHATCTAISRSLCSICRPLNARQVQLSQQGMQLMEAVFKLLCTLIVQQLPWWATPSAITYEGLTD